MRTRKEFFPTKKNPTTPSTTTTEKKKKSGQKKSEALLSRLVRVACFDAPVGHHTLTPSLCASLTKGRQPLLNRASTPHNDNYSTLYSLSLSLYFSLFSCHNYNFYLYFYSQPLPPSVLTYTVCIYIQASSCQSPFFTIASLIHPSLSTTTTTKREEPAANKRTPTRRKLNKSQDTIIPYYYTVPFLLVWNTRTHK